MNWDKLENYVHEHRDDIDDKIPPENVWDSIVNGLSDNKWYNNINYWKAAAVVFFVLSAGLLVNTIIESYAVGQSPLASEFEDTESYYFNLIQDKESLLVSYLKDYPILANDFKKDLADLTNNYKILKNDYDATGSTEVLSALIKNLQLQQELLNNQLKVIELIKNENENVSI